MVILILEQILAPGQYAENVATVPGSANRVEFAIKMPGQIKMAVNSAFSERKKVDIHRGIKG